MKRTPPPARPPCDQQAPALAWFRTWREAVELGAHDRAVNALDWLRLWACGRSLAIGGSGTGNKIRFTPGESEPDGMIIAEPATVCRFGSIMTSVGTAGKPH